MSENNSHTSSISKDSITNFYKYIRNNWYPFIDFIVIISWSLLIQPLLISKIESESLEELVDWLNLSSILLPILQFGLLASFTRYYFRIDSRILLIKLTVIHSTLFLITLPILYLMSVSLEIIIYCFSNYALSILLYRSRFKFQPISYMLTALIFPIAYIILLTIKPLLNYNNFSTTVYAASTLIILFYTGINLKEYLKIKSLSIEKNLLSEIIKYSVNAFIGTILLLIMGRVLVYISKTNFTINDYTLFSILLTFANIPVTITGLISKTFLHKLYDKENNKTNIYRYFAKLYSTILVMLIIIFPIIAERLYPNLPNVGYYAMVILFLKGLENFTTYVDWHFQNENKLIKLYTIYFIPMVSFILTIFFFSKDSKLLIYYFLINLLLHLFIKNKKLYSLLNA